MKSTTVTYPITTGGIQLIVPIMLRVGRLCPLLADCFLLCPMRKSCRNSRSIATSTSYMIDPFGIAGLITGPIYVFRGLSAGADSLVSCRPISDSCLSIMKIRPVISENEQTRIPALYGKSSLFQFDQYGACQSS